MLNTFADQLGISWDQLRGLSQLERHDLRKHIVNTVPPPQGRESWYKSVVAVFVLGCSQDVRLIDFAVNKLSPRMLPGNSCSNRTSCELAARGSAIKAMEWVGHYDHEQSWQEEMRDEL